MNEFEISDEVEENDRWIYGRGCPLKIGKDDPLKIYELIEDKNERTLKNAKEACANKCNDLLNCYYAVLNYDEDRPENADCTLIDSHCGDWINYENQINRYFYKKGTNKKIITQRQQK